MLIAEIIGPDILIVGAVILVLLFGGSKLPELARALGSAKNEFEQASKDAGAKGSGTAAPGATGTEPSTPASTSPPSSSAPSSSPAADDD